MNKQIKILGIETSCDETAAAIVDSDLKIISNIVSSQINLHKKYGGVYPELASRAHLENIIPVISATLKKGKLDFSQIDAIAVTIGPGLIGSLLVGVETAKTLAYIFKKPLIPINHLEGHIAANFIDGNSKSEILNSKQIHNSSFLIHNSNLFPILNLIVSGGHTSLVLMKDFGQYKTIGSTRDDAAGEAFDKVAQLLGLPYPGGPAIEKAASKIHNSSFKPKVSPLGIIHNSIKLPRPMLNSVNFDFSFSGLKTAVLQLTKELGPAKTIRQRRTSLGLEKFRNEIAAEFQNAVIDVLITKTLRAAKKHKVKTIMLSGGVSANSFLRKKFKFLIRDSRFLIRFLVPPKNLCTDNAAMIAAAGIFRFTKNKKQSLSTTRRQGSGWQEISAKSNLELR